MSQRSHAAVRVGITAIALSGESVGLAAKGGVPHATKPSDGHAGGRKSCGRAMRNGASNGGSAARNDKGASGDVHVVSSLGAWGLRRSERRINLVHI